VCKWLGAVSVISGIGIAVMGIYEYKSNAGRERELANAFKKGSVPKPIIEDVIERKKLSKDIAQILQPPMGYNKYNLIVGYHGGGKTTLVRHVGHQYSGIIYIIYVPDKLIAMTDLII